MSVAARALWFIELHLSDDLSLGRVAAVVGVSKFHLSHAFSATLGMPIASYVRARRLTQAAQALAAGAPEILPVALDAGYGSHEAFTRAFTQQFGVSPEQVRQAGHSNGLALQAPVRLDRPATVPLAPPRVERGRLLRLAGVTDRHRGITGLPSQWSRFMPHIGHVDGQVDSIVYGVTYNTDDTGAFDYLCGVEVSQFPARSDLARLTVPAQTYAVFTHTEHISSVATTVGAIWNEGLRDAGHTFVEGPFLERYDERFDHRTGLGGFEIWWPIAVEPES